MGPSSVINRAESLRFNRTALLIRLCGGQRSGRVHVNALFCREWFGRGVSVAVAPRGREFAWLVGGRYARWSYRFKPVPGGTQLTETWEFLAEGPAMFREKYGPGADARIELRRSQAIAGIPVTLAAIEQIAKAPRPG